MIGVVVRGAVLLVAVHAGIWLLRRASGGTRSLVWNTAFLALLALPGVIVLVPSWRLPLHSSIGVLLPGEPTTHAVARAPELSASALRDGAPDGGAIASSLPAEWLDVTALLEGLSALWLGGACLLLAALVARHVRAALVVRRAEPLDSAVWNRDARAVGARCGVHAPLVLLRSDAVAVPVVTGVIRPRLLFPPDAADWSPARRRVVLLHELSHVRRGDVAMKLVIDLATVLHWMNPLVWLSQSRAALAREQACDDAVLVAGIAPAEYAGHLLALARRLTARSLIATAGAAMAGQTGRSGVERRVRALLQADGRRLPPGRLLRAVAPLALLAVLWPIAAVTFFPGGAEPLERALTDPRAEVRSTTVWALGEHADGSAGTALIPLLRDSVADVRQQTAWALGELGIETAIPHLIAALDDGHAEVRARAAWALGEMRAPAARPALTRLLGRDRQPEVRAQAAWALTELGER